MKRPVVIVAVICVLSASGLGLLAFQCRFDPQLNFLPRDGRAAWIIFPAPAELTAHPVASVDTVFRRSFSIQHAARARLVVRAAKRVELKLNHERVALAKAGNWKREATVDVSSSLQPGENVVEARVFNAHAPPALWLALETNEGTIQSDGSWEASCAGSGWRHAVPADQPPHPMHGNVLADTETTIDALKATWPTSVLAGALALAISTLATWRAKQERQSRYWPFFALGACVALWLALFGNNALTFPFLAGFDAPYHADYIRYVMEHRSLPLPGEGFEMFQPPLYYVVSAVALGLFRLSVGDPAGILVLRLLTTLFGIATFTFAFLSVRLLFPASKKRQIIGLGLAAFMPMQLYLSHYVTNETMAAALSTAAIYLTLDILKHDKRSSFSYLLVGVVVGAAMLAKVTALLLIPAIVAVLLVRDIRREATFTWSMVCRVGLLLLACFAVCGWNYLRIWMHVGRPMVANWEAASGFNWWQDPGFHTVRDYWRFGRSLFQPLFSGMFSFWDGVYSTMWGDAVAGGVSNLDFRPPWNLQLMTSGYLLALLPSALIVLGIASALGNAVRRRSQVDWFLLGLFAILVASLLAFSLRVSSYAVIKAFYAPMLVPLCYFAVLGWELVTRRRRAVQTGVCTLLLLFAMISYLTVWIPGSSRQQVYAALELTRAGDMRRAGSALDKALAGVDLNAHTERVLALLLDISQRHGEALEHARRAVQLDPNDGECQLQLANSYAAQSDFDVAIAHGDRALVLAPGLAAAYPAIADWLLRTGHADLAVERVKQGLAVAPRDPALHTMLGRAASETSDWPTAITHFSYALMLHADWQQTYNSLHQSVRALLALPDAAEQLRQAADRAPDAPDGLDELAWTYATHLDSSLRDGNAAVRLAERGCELTGYNDAGLLATLAAGHAETGRFDQALEIARKALALSRISQNAEVILTSEKLLAAFQERRAYHVQSATP